MTPFSVIEYFHTLSGSRIPNLTFKFYKQEEPTPEIGEYLRSKVLMSSLPQEWCMQKISSETFLNSVCLDSERALVMVNSWWFLQVGRAGGIPKRMHPALVAQMVKNLPTMQEMPVQSLGQEDPLEKGMATHFSILAWRMPRTEEPGELQSMGSQRTGHSWVTNIHTPGKGDSWSWEVCGGWVLCWAITPNPYAASLPWDSGAQGWKDPQQGIDGYLGSKAQPCPPVSLPIFVTGLWVAIHLEVRRGEFDKGRVGAYRGGEDPFNDFQAC